MEILTIKVLSYCDIPEWVRESKVIFEEANSDSYIRVNIVSKKEQEKYDDDFEFINWVIANYPNCEGEDILIHMDY